MTDYKHVGIMALWWAFYSSLFVFCLFFFLVPVSTPALLAALGLVPAAGGVVGALVTLSFADEDDH